jgi:hypothetical protein
MANAEMPLFITAVSGGILSYGLRSMNWSDPTVEINGVAAYLNLR